jgi:hypothetical protein
MKEMKCLLVERFQILEKRGPMTATEFARRMWITQDAARVWLSRMTNYKRPDGPNKAYLVYDPPHKKTVRVRGKRVRLEGTYRINPDPKCDWTELYCDFA